MNLYSTPGSQQGFDPGNGGVRYSADVIESESHHVDLRSMYKGENYFTFILKEPIHQRISREDASNYREPGWTIEDSRNREVDVIIDIPIGMRRQIPGHYKITYTAKLMDGSSEPLGVQVRNCEIFDINECDLGTHDCSPNADCVHLSQGGYKCVCKSGYRGTGQTCKDIDECKEGSASCDIHATCVNTPGSYTCECNPGFRKIGEFCEDINECADGTHDCSPFANCQNLPGSYKCKCFEDYEGDGKTCTPINKCATGAINCHHYANCVVLGSGEFKCECKQGFRGNGITNCDDIDECSENPNICPPNSKCKNTFGGYQCVCDPGFQRTASGKCEDINECLLGIHHCPIHSDCFNTIGSYNCECHDGYVKTEAGKCEDMTGVPKLTLKGPNPMTINLFETYSEPGFLLEDEKEEMEFTVRVPPKLHGVARHCGRFEVTYRAVDLTTHKEAFRTRTVHVNEVNQCNLEPNHPFRHNCHEYANCVYLTGQCDYVCKCPPGFNGDGFGSNGCIDAVPPTFYYDGPDPYNKEVCVVCGSVINQKPDLEEPIITKAYDNTPYGKVDVSDNIRLTTEKSDLGDDCIVHHYTVSDKAGNIASKRLTVCLKIEDMRTTILEMKAMYSWQMWLIRNVAFLCVLAFILFCIWEFGHRIASCIRVFTGANPSHDDKDTAYSLWYRITNPLASKASIRKYTNEKILLDDDDEDSDDDMYSDQYDSEDSEYDSDE